MLSQNRKKRSTETMNASNQNTVTSISALTSNPEQCLQVRLAIESNDYDAFKRLFSSNYPSPITPNDLDEIGGPSFLMIASEVGSTRIVKELIVKGADMDYQDNDLWTALIVASKEGHIGVVLELIESGASVDLRDANGWTALMWASYKGKGDIVEVLLKKNTSPNIFDNENHMTPLCWASGRGFVEIVSVLLKHGAKVDIGDKYGTSPLIWASRKGYVEICRMLVMSGANIDCVGMFGWSPLIVATRGNYTEVVELLLSYRPNVNPNICDPQGLTPLITASKEGNIDIVNALLYAHVYVNLSDKNGDTALIHAAKSGHLLVVEALIKAHADFDHQSLDRKTALYWAVDKGHIEVVRALLKVNVNMELATKDTGDTALLRAVRNHKTQIVKMLLDNKAKVNVADKYGDTALHIAARSQSKAILELILRNPKNSQILYKPNKRGETAFSIDSLHPKPILPTLFGAAPSNRRVLEKESQLGYDLYSSAIANLLSEPQLKTPICIGLFAKWGSGKSFLIGKLKDDLISFSSSWSSSYLDDSVAGSRNGFTWTSALTAITLSILVGVSVLVASNGAFIPAFISLIATLILCYTFLGVVLYCGHYEMSRGIKVKLEQMKLILLVTFANPPKLSYDTVASLPVRFIFCDSPGVKVGSVGEGGGVGGSFSQFMCTVLDSLWQAIEDEFGYLPIRLYRVFKPRHIISRSDWKWRRTCFMIPTLGLLMFFLITCSGLLVLYYISLKSEMDTSNANANVAQSLEITTSASLHSVNSTENVTVTTQTEESTFPLSSSVTRYILVAFASVIATWILVNIAVPFKIVREIFFPIRRNKHLDGPAIKEEVDLISSCLFCFDAFDGRRQSRIALVLDALESVYESERLITFLEAINSHLANPSMSTHLNDPFVTILALDPHHHATSKSREYLKTIVHLPFYLQNSQLRRVRIAQTAATRILDGRSGSTASIVDAITAPGTSGVTNAGDGNVLKSTASNLSRSTSKLTGLHKKGALGKSQLTLKPAESVASLFGPSGEAPTKVLLTDDYFSDINPKSLRRIMNIVYVEGRLLKAFNIDFSWHRLTVWINITDQFPLRASAILVYCEMMESRLTDDSVTVKSIYEKLAPIISSTEFAREVDVIYRREDSDEKKFLIFATGINLVDIKVFSPFTINVDPNYRRMLQEFFSRNQNSSALFGITGNYRTNSICSISTGLHNTRDNLADLSVDGVISLLRTIEGFSTSNMEKYTKALRENNINGKVLAAVNGSERDLEELKVVLGFSFGDWLLFKRIILLGKIPSSHQLAPSSTHINLNQLDQSTSQQQPPTQITPNPSNRPLMDMKSRLLEKQVTLEEAALASSIIVESPSTDSPSSSSDAPQIHVPSSASPRFGGSSGDGPSRKASALSDQISLISEQAEVEVLYIGSSGPGQKSSPSVISYQAESFPLVERGAKPPKDLVLSSSTSTTAAAAVQSTQSAESAGEMEEPTERTPLMSPSRHSITSSGSTNASGGPPGTPGSTTSSSSRKKGLLERQKPASPEKRETNF